MYGAVHCRQNDKRKLHGKTLSARESRVKSLSPSCTSSAQRLWQDTNFQLYGRKLPFFPCLANNLSRCRSPNITWKLKMSVFNINCKHIMNELIDNLFEPSLYRKLESIHGMSDDCGSGVWKPSLCRKASVSLRFFPLQQLCEAFWKYVEECGIKNNYSMSTVKNLDCRKLSICYEIGKLFSCSWTLHSDRLISKRSGIFSVKKQRMEIQKIDRLIIHY